MNLSLGTTVSAFTVFLQGILSFLSPCIFPLVPLYIGYLASGAKTVKEDGSIYYKRGKVMLHTVCFVVGVSFAFFLLGFGFTALGTFFTNNRVWFARIGGIIIILFGLIQLIGSPWKKEHRFSFQLNRYTMNPLTAFLFGFTFSFAWTPCVGPVLTSVLLMASSAQSSTTGFLLIGVYTLGFILPFLALGLFTSQLLAFFKKTSEYPVSNKSLTSSDSTKIDNAGSPKKYLSVIVLLSVRIVIFNIVTAIFSLNQN